MGFLENLLNSWEGDRDRERTKAYLERLVSEPIRVARSRTARLLARFLAAPGPHVTLGATEWGEPVTLPLIELVKACGLTTGGMGTGKTMFALLPIEAMVRLLPELSSMAFGVIDAKGELFERALYLLARRAHSLDPARRRALLNRLVVIDFAGKSAVTPYNILAPWAYAERDFFVTSRLETLRELLPSSDKLSLRGSDVLRNALALLAEFSLPVTYVERLLSDEDLRKRLVARSRNPDVSAYFEKHFRTEGRPTVAAVRSRLEALFAAEGVRLALSGASAPDFRALQEDGKIVLINCAGPTITRGVRLLLQGLVLSDIRQAIFARPNNPRVTYLWCADEAQNFFLTRQQQDDMADILTMARSFGSFFYFLCQNLSTAVPDARILETLHTNIRWSLTMRSTPRDATFLRAALPVTGCKRKPQPDPFKPPATYTTEEERALLYEGIAHLPDREGYLWLKAHLPEAIRLTTRGMRFPEGDAFRTVVTALRDDSTLGGRLSRAAHEQFIRERDRVWLADSREPAPDPIDETKARQQYGL
jgi:hypothetical protein